MVGRWVEAEEEEMAASSVASLGISPESVPSVWSPGWWQRKAINLSYQLLKCHYFIVSTLPMMIVSTSFIIALNLSDLF